MIWTQVFSPSPSVSSTRTSKPRWIDAVDHRLLRAVRRLAQDLHVVRADPAAGQLADRPHESHYELVRGLLVELLGRAHLLDPALVQHHDLLGDLHRLLLVVRDEHGRHVDLVVEATQPGAQLLAHGGVERAEGLVEQQHARLDRERAGERHALALAARELGGIAVREAVEVHELQQLVHARLDLLLGPLADREPEGHVLRHGHVLEGRVVLEDEADVAALRRLLGRVLAGDVDPAAVGRLEPGDHPQQRGLAAAAGAEQGREGAVADLERHVVERDELAEALRHGVDDDAHP